MAADHRLAGRRHRQATFGVEDYEEFIGTQAESALRQVTTAHPYDDDASHGTTSLRGSTDQVAAELAERVADRASLAGLEILERASPRSPTPRRDAQAMLQRQQASALLAARGRSSTAPSDWSRAHWPDSGPGVVAPRRRAPCGNGVQPAGGAVR